MKKKNAWHQSDGAVSILVVLMGFLVGTILVAIVGKNPLNMYKAILQALSGYNIDNGRMNVRYIGETLNYSVPFILCGLSMGFANRVGLFNIGGEGQYIMGMTVAQIIALLGPQIPVLHWLLALLGAMLIGAIWGGVVGILKAKYEVSVTKVAPKADTRVISAFQTLGFKVYVDASVSYAGYLDRKSVV